MSVLGISSISATVAGIDPVNGWVLWSKSDQDSDGFWFEEYFARSEASDRYLHVSRFDFSPSQERFAFLVRNEFPSVRIGESGSAPWCNETIDAAIERERLERDLNEKLDTRRANRARASAAAFKSAATRRANERAQRERVA